MPQIKQLRETTPFSRLPDEIFERMQSQASVRHYPAGMHLFHQNDEPTGYLYVIRSGKVEITILTEAGEEIVVDYRYPGQFFGGTPIFNRAPYTAGARTVKETECYLVPAAILLEAEKEVPQFGTYFTHEVISRVRRLYADIISTQTQKALTQVEAYPFQKRLSEMMTTQLITCSLDTCACDIGQLMTQHTIDSVIVINAEGQLAGIVTGKDLIGKVIAERRRHCEGVTAADIMTPNPYTMQPETYMYEAMAFMQGHHIKHMPIVDGEDLVGVVTQSDLMRYRSQKAMLLIGSIREAKNLEQLAEIHGEIVRVAHSLMTETRSAPEVMEILSYIHHSLIQRSFNICLEQMQDEGYGPPPIEFSFLIMGSGGRREMLLGPDQDNAFIYADYDDSLQPTVDAFFKPLADKVTHALDYVGYPLCEGNVMVSNPVWRGQLRDWRRRIRDWAENPEPVKVRYSSIFFDFTPLSGNVQLAHDLQEMVYDLVREFPGFLFHVMNLNLTHKVPTGFWGKFQVEKSGAHKGQLSVKKGGLVYIVDCIRMFALEYEVRALPTLERLKGLSQLNIFAEETAEHIRVAFESLSFFRLRHELECIQAGESPSHYLDPYSLSKSEQDLLRESFQAVNKLQEATKHHFGRGLS